MTDFVALTEWAWLLGLGGLGIASGIYGYVKKQPAVLVGSKRAGD